MFIGIVARSLSCYTSRNIWHGRVAMGRGDCSARSCGLLQNRAAPSDNSSAAGLPTWSWLEVVILASITALALALRVWELKDVPFNIYPDEVMTGLVTERAYLSGPGPAPSLFSTLWSDIDLPALWFAIVAGIFKLGGVGLATVRLPAALFGAATVLPLYGFVRSVWGRVAAIAAASVMAFGAANVHCSRMALSNITTPFFWAVCFFFLIRGLRSRKPSDWALAGLAAGISEHFYYGTRLLPFILMSFVVYLLIVHWTEARRYFTQLGWLVFGYLSGFGPLLTYFVTHPGSYYGRGAGLMTWNRIPSTWHDLQQMWTTLWPIMSENLLGISTQSAQDIMYYARLLVPAEAALLVLGVALLAWRWRHPAAFLVLLSGLGVLVVGGTLVLYRNSAQPMLAHWTPAFPAFYAATAVPIGAWVGSTEVWLCVRKRWITIGVVASLGPAYRVVVVGQSPYPYDADTTRYLVAGQEYMTIRAPQKQLSLEPVGEKGLAFLFFPGNEQYQERIRERYTRGRAGEVRNPVGRHLFYTYVVEPETVRSNSQGQ